jgi:hypothetical protein
VTRRVLVAEIATYTIGAELLSGEGLVIRVELPEAADARDALDELAARLACALAERLHSRSTRSAR